MIDFGPNYANIKEEQLKAMLIIKNFISRKTYNRMTLYTTLRNVIYSNRINDKENRQQFISASTKIRSNPALMKLSTPEFYSIFTEELKFLMELFKKHKYELRIAGGAVRDLLLGQKPKDIDFATTATPYQMKTMFESENVRMINAKGEKHGTITPRINNKENFEITTLRIDVRTNGRHAEVQFTTDWQLDANRRDLTINSMFLGFDGTLYDYFFGYDDLQDRRVVFVGDAAVRIQEDYLRILRYFRFYGRISEKPDNHDENTLNAIKSNVEGLSKISGERIWSELQKIVCGSFAEQLVLEMINCNVATFCGLPVRPNVEEFKRFHSILKQFDKPHNPILAMIALLNNVEDAISMHERLKLSAFERDLTFFIIQQRDQVDRDYVDLRDYQKLCLQTNVKREFVEELLKYRGKSEFFKNLKTWEMPTFPLNGNLLREKGCPPGKKMGVIVMKLRSIWIESDFQITASELLEKHLPKVMLSISTPPATPHKKVKKL